MILFRRFILIKQVSKLVTGEGTKPATRLQPLKKLTDAFIVYCSICASVHPTSVQSLFKYMRDVRMRATKGEGLVVLDGKSIMNSLDCAEALFGW